MKKSILSRLRTLLVLTLALALVLSLTGCFQKDDPDPTGGGEDPTGQVDPTGTAEPTDEPTEEPTDAPTEAPTAPPQKSVMGTVTANNLNVRSNASTDSTVLSQLPVDLRIEVLEQKTVGETNWGRIGEMVLPNGTKVTGGWINMSYVKLDGAEPEDPVSDPTAPTSGTSDPVVSGTGKKGTVTAESLNIRKSTTTASDRVGSYIKGDVVEILEQKTVDGTTWGRTNKGWVSMKYIKLEGQTSAPEDDDDDGKTTSSDVVSDGKTKVLGYGVVDLGSLNVRSGPGTNYDKVGTVSEGSRYAYYQKSGNWVRIKNGWVSVSYFYLEGNTASDGGTGTVTSDVNIRKGPGTSFDKVDSLEKDETVKILAQVNGWGYTGKGWVSMKYVELESEKVTYTAGKGTITADELNIRKTADGEKTGKVYKKGDKVEVTKVEGEWGQTKDGWISMKYVKMDSTSTTTYKTGKGTITANELNVRKGPGTSYDKTGKVHKKGDKVNVTEISGNWGKTADGWIHMQYVKMDTAAEEDNVGKNTTFKKGEATVEVNSTLTIRKSASTSAEKVGTYKNGDKVTVTEVSGEWGKTDKGWINLRYVKYN